MNVFLILALAAISMAPAQAARQKICKALDGTTNGAIRIDSHSDLSLTAGPCQTITLFCSASDIDYWYYTDTNTKTEQSEHPDTMQYTWGSNAPGFTVPVGNTQSAVEWTIPASASGTYTFTVTVSDKHEHGSQGDDVNSSPLTFTVTVSAEIAIEGPSLLCVNSCAEFLAVTNPIESAPCVTWTGLYPLGCVPWPDGSRYRAEAVTAGTYYVTASIGGQMMDGTLRFPVFCSRLHRFSSGNNLIH